MSMLTVPAAAVALLAGLVPPVVAQEAQVFPGFTAVDAYAQGQVATGYFYAVGDEQNRLVGAQATVNGPPAGSQAVAAFFQRGVAASYTYGLVGGGGPGKKGVLPEPPPGEAAAYFPAQPEEATFTGPVTAGADGQAVDGRFHATATDVPTARAEAAVTHLVVPDQLEVSQAVIVSHTEPAEGGVAAESRSVLRGVTIGPLNIEQMVSHASGFVSAGPDEPKGTATTVLQGVTVNDTPVKITDQGVVVADNANPGAQAQVNAALTEAGFENILLTPSAAAPGEDGQSVEATTGSLRIVHRDEAFGAANPQGFSGGGFLVGGAEVRLLGQRAAAVSNEGGSEDAAIEGEEPAEGTPDMPPEAALARPAVVPPAQAGMMPTPASAAPSVARGIVGRTGAPAPALIPGDSFTAAETGVDTTDTAVSLISPDDSVTTAATPSGAPESLPASGSPQVALTAASKDVTSESAADLRDGYLIFGVVLTGIALGGARFIRVRGTA